MTELQYNMFVEGKRSDEDIVKLTYQLYANLSPNGRINFRIYGEYMTLHIKGHP